MKIGFVGLGNRGNAIAVNLLRAGHRLVINDLAREMQSNLEIQGAKWCDDLRLLAQGCEAVFTALPGPAEVEQVMLGDSGVFAGMAPGTSYIDLSTSSAKVAAVLAAADGTLLEKRAERLDTLLEITDADYDVRFARSTDNGVTWAD